MKKEVKKNGQIIWKNTPADVSAQKTFNWYGFIKEGNTTFTVTANMKSRSEFRCHLHAEAKKSGGQAEEFIGVLK